MMKIYKVYGSEITKSRYGSYVYNITDRIEAESGEEAAKIYKEQHKAPAGRRWSVRVNKTIEVGV